MEFCYVLKVGSRNSVFNLINKLWRKVIIMKHIFRSESNEHIKVRNHPNFFFLAALHGLWDVSSPSKDSACALSTESANHWTPGEFPHLASSALVPSPAKLSTSVCILYRKVNIMKEPCFKRQHFPQHRRLTIICIIYCCDGNLHFKL